MKKRQVKFCSIGLGGNHMQYGGGCTGSWYLHDVDEIASRYAAELAEGVLCLDKRPALEGPQGNYANAYASPMVNVEMPDGEIDRFGSRHADRGGIMIEALKETSYGPILQAAEIAAEVAPEAAGPLDHVPISEYVKWWTDRGADLYRYDGRQFVQIAQ